jgi:4,5-dihydroxyphthalate decarboxylase
MVVKDEVLEAHPGLGPDLFDAFAESKRIYLERLKSGAIEKPTAVDEMHKRVMEITGRDPPALRHRAQPATLEEVIESALEQKIITKRVTVEDLFPRNTHHLVA